MKNQILSTQAIAGRSFKILDPNIDFNSQNQNKEMIKVLLLEDSYICWIELT